MRGRILLASIAVLSVSVCRVIQGTASGAPDRLALAAPHERAATTPAATPILVELFTSEGCSSCPPADSLLQKLLASQPLPGAEIIGLGEHVDYWDRQGWKDRFSSAAFTTRQQVYAARFRTESIYTPQIVVDGRAELVGSDAGALRRALERAVTAPHGTIRIELDPGGVPSEAGEAVAITVSSLPAVAGRDRADVVVAVTEDRLRSEITRGENRGRTLTHAAVVRYLTTIGEAAANGSSTLRAAIPIDPSWQRDQLKTVAFVQEHDSRHILGAASLPIRSGANRTAP